MRKFISVIAAVLMICLFCGCGVKEVDSVVEDNQLSIVATIFPPYDFAREIVESSDAEVTMLIPPGTESHGYEPTLKNIADIQKCDVFIYVGGNTDSWAEKVLESCDISEKKIVRLMSIEGLKLHNLSGEDGDAHDSHQELDEHIWTSPKNAELIVNAISEAICSADAENSEVYSSNRKNYIDKLQNIDKEIRDIVSKGESKPLIFADRFPFSYLTEEYGIKYFATLSGCSSDTEPTITAVNNLVSAINKYNISIILYVDSSDGTVADKISGMTGTKKRLLHSCHNLAADEFRNNETYLTLMQKNVDVLREALS